MPNVEESGNQDHHKDTKTILDELRAILPMRIGGIECDLSYLLRSDFRKMRLQFILYALKYSTKKHLAKILNSSVEEESTIKEMYFYYDNSEDSFNYPIEKTIIKNVIDSVLIDSKLGRKIKSGFQPDEYAIGLAHMQARNHPLFFENNRGTKFHILTVMPALKTRIDGFFSFIKQDLERKGRGPISFYFPVKTKKIIRKKDGKIHDEKDFEEYRLFILPIHSMWTRNDQLVLKRITDFIVDGKIFLTPSITIDGLVDIQPISQGSMRGPINDDFKAKLTIPDFYKERIKSQYFNSLYDNNSLQDQTISDFFDSKYMPIRISADWESMDSHQEVDLRGKKFNSPESLNDVIEANTHGVIVGEPGTGKTTLLLREAYSMLTDDRGDWRFPFYLPLQALSVKVDDISPIIPNPLIIKSLIDHYIETHFPSDKSELLKKSCGNYCNRGRVVLFLDGLEHLEHEIQNNILISIQQFASWHHGIKSISTTSENRSDFPCFITKWFIEKWSLKEKHQFIKNWYQQINGMSESNDEMKKLRTELREIVSTPSEMRVLGKVFQSCVKQQVPPKKNIPLIKYECIDGIIDHRVRKQGARFQIDAIRKNQIHMNIMNFLGRIAYQTLIENDREQAIDKRYALFVLRDIYSGKNVNDEVLVHHLNKLFSMKGIFISKYLPRTVTFKDQYIFNYFVARHIVNDTKNDIWERISPYIGSNEWRGRWKDIIPIMVGKLYSTSPKQANEFINKLQQSKMFFNKYLAVKSIQEIFIENTNKNVLRVLKRELLAIVHGNEQIHDVIGEVTKSEQYSCRNYNVSHPLFYRIIAAELLGSIGDDRIRFPDEIEQYFARVDGVMVGKYPVTNKEYLSFMSEKECYNPQMDWWSDSGRDWHILNPNISHPRNWPELLQYPNLPVVGVSWHEVQAYINWMNDKLSGPYYVDVISSEEWEKIFSTLYSQNDEPMQIQDIIGPYNLFDSNIGSIAPVGSINDDILVRDFIGNVWEWCYGRSGSPEGNPVTKGGAFDIDGNTCEKLNWTNKLEAGKQELNTGFRLVLKKKRNSG